MDKISYPVKGSCRCGKLEIALAAPPVLTAACHCRGCQKMSSSAFSLTAMCKSDSFRVVRGTPVKGGVQGPELDHFFCPDCKTWMFTRITGMDDFVNVRPTLFDQKSLATPFIETMTSEKLPWVSIPAQHSFTGFPDVDDFMKLLDDFSQTQDQQGSRRG
ncbi:MULTISPECIES: GFA family protein [Thalassospira]|jgi:hypothetical protein|uniref:Aldehyde-activating protein n=1 Tax=Thalassospira xiamenensis TaxID=220697 RepID=A0ABR5Y1M5_9PROT|nr:MULTISPECIES: GFA family protein [Thalassospira]MBL4843519.1 GFA family protein [Thalassospira sp.]MBR9780859.1 GFA family protein [Rhodospirillales bacterium]KZD03572.1 aldehyde-activating protein [Thalassospira xiamenensis]KZD08601.1 aldehyde-activating protein [Thalassospira xiamenensis]MBR9818803.1 GFA family protein [Rhodospirillales bacterium]|tara:strand:+ start:1157 stop:1636 length:480 start_codon:yes stop_codon:yes gene_type:complete